MRITTFLFGFQVFGSFCFSSCLCSKALYLSQDYHCFVSLEILTPPNHVQGLVKGLLSSISHLKLREGILPICNITLPSSPTDFNTSPLLLRRSPINFDIPLVLSQATITLHRFI